MDLDQYMSKSAIEKRKATAKFMDEIYEDLKPFYIKKEFPWFVVPKLQKLGINGCHIKDFGGPAMNNVEVGAILYEMAKRDASVCTFFLVHNLIGQNVVDALGDNE